MCWGMPGPGLVLRVIAKIYVDDRVHRSLPWLAYTVSTARPTSGGGFLRGMKA